MYVKKTVYISFIFILLYCMLLSEGLQTLILLCNIVLQRDEYITLCLNEKKCKETIIIHIKVKRILWLNMT